MLFQSLHDFPTLLAVAVISLVLRGLYNRYGRGLQSIPGPFIASVTELWRFFIIFGWRVELRHIELHRKYGDVVRIGPRTVLVRDWALVKTIYAPNSKFVKSGFYPVQRPIANGKQLHGLFNTEDEYFHSRLRRSVASAYSMSNLVQFEPFVDSTIAAFISQLNNRYVNKPGEEGILDFGLWLRYYAFDVIGELTFSKRLGFVDEGRDIDNIIHDLEGLLNYFATVGQAPWLDLVLNKNPILLWLRDRGFISNTSPVAVFAKAQMADRDITEKKVDAAKSSAYNHDFLARFLEAHEKDPEFVHKDRVLALTAANVFAGSDTTAITLRSAFYFLMKNPEKLARLMEELGDPSLGPEDSIVSWNQTRRLPYLTAVIQESLRLHPAIGLPLERVVPETGLRVGNIVLPPGTVVGTTAWALHRKESIFGPNVDQFIPERWIDSPAEKIAEMNNAMFSFGMGARTCVGKNISFLEMYKLVPTIFRQYQLSFAHENSDWHIHNAWFVKQTNFLIRIKRRK